MTTKLCTKCGNTKSTEEFGKNKTRKDGVAAYCKVCTKTLNSIQQANRTPEQIAKQRERKRLAANTPEKRAKRLEYSRTDEAKTQRLIRDQTSEGRSNQQHYRDSDKGKAAVKAYQATEGFKKSVAKRKAFLQTEEGTAERKATTNKYRKSDKGKKTSEAYRHKHGLKVQARAAVNNAARYGFPHISTQICDCGQPAVEYHHYLGYDYGHWMDVIPLCRTCHTEAED